MAQNEGRIFGCLGIDSWSKLRVSWGELRPMQISADAKARDIEPAVDWISGFIGAAVDKRVLAYEERERRNPLLTSYYRANFALEFALARARKYKKQTGRVPKGDEFDSLYGFLIQAQRIHAKLPQAALSGFGGALRGALNDANGLTPFAYEISIATHLMQKGWDVEFADRCGLARFDFLARQDNIEIEIECKTASGDAGRKIHRQEVNRLADLILPAIQDLGATAGCHLIRVIIPDRLAPAERELTEIASTVALVGPDSSSCSCELALVDYRYENISDWPDPRRNPDAREFFENLLDTKNSHILFHSRAGHSIVAVVIASAKADSVVNAVAKQVKDAADQCSGTRPAVIALQFIDQISHTALASLLKTPNGLHAIARAVFNGTRNRSHVDSIAFTIPPLMQFEAAQAKRLSAPVLSLFNDQPRFECERVRMLFR